VCAETLTFFFMTINLNKPINFFFPIYFLVAITLGFLDLVSWWVILLFFLHDIKIVKNEKKRDENN